MKYKYKIGDKVKTRCGVGEVLFIDDGNIPYLVGIKGHSGHSGETILTKEEKQKYVIDKGYENQCRWFEEYRIESIKEKKKMKFKIGDKVKIDFGVEFRIGKVLFIDDSDTIFPYLVGIKGYDGHSGNSRLTKEEIQEYVIDKGYEYQCIWLDEDRLELIKEENKMNRYVKLLMEDLRLEVREEFDIIDDFLNPYHFDEEGNLIDKDGEKANSIVYFLMNGTSKIKGIKLTEQEKEALESYKRLGYTTIDEILEANK